MTNYVPLQIANTFIERYANQCNGIDHMKLQKLIYYTYGWWLVNHSDPLLTEEPQAWKFGPVFKSLYRNLYGFRNAPITRPQSYAFNVVPPQVSNDDIVALMDWIWNKYGHLSGGQLSDATHAPGTPWYTTASQYNFQIPENVSIKKEVIADFFSRELQVMQANG